MPCSTSTPRIRSTRRSRSTAASDNIFDNRYATYGTFFDTTDVPNFANGGAPFTDAAFGQPGTAARLLRGPEGDILEQRE